MKASIRLELTLTETVDAEGEQFQDLVSRLTDIRDLLGAGQGEVTVQADRRTGSSSSERSEARPQEEYKRPLLQALVDLDGGAHRGRVFDLIEERLDLSEADRANTNSGATRWKKHTEWMASRLRPEYVERPNQSGWGVWELTDKGWELAAELGLTED